MSSGMGPVRRKIEQAFFLGDTLVTNNIGRFDYPCPELFQSCCMMNERLRRVVVYNDAGCMMLQDSRHEAARDLFAGALQTLQLQAAVVRGIESSSATATVDSTLQAENQLAAIATSTTVGVSSEAKAESAEVYVSSFPWIVKAPFMVCLPPSPEVETELMLQYFDLSIAKVLFNVGLSRHLVQPNDAEVPGLYHMASASLSNVPDSSETLFLALAVMNNFAIWCYHTGDRTGLGSCMEQMHHLLEEEPEYPINNGRSLDAIRTNIRLLRVVTDDSGMDEDGAPPAGRLQQDEKDDDDRGDENAAPY